MESSPTSSAVRAIAFKSDQCGVFPAICVSTIGKNAPTFTGRAMHGSFLFHHRGTEGYKGHRGNPEEINHEGTKDAKGYTKEGRIFFKSSPAFVLFAPSWFNSLSLSAFSVILSASVVKSSTISL